MSDSESLVSASIDHATEVDEVVDWRVAVLRQAGYEHDQALMLALRVDIDLHLAVDLVERGCPASTALQILL